MPSTGRFPDSFDIGRNLLGIAIFWSIGLAAYRGEHITVDLAVECARSACPARDGCVRGNHHVACLSVFAWMMGDKVLSTYRDNVLTFDVHLPVWIFYTVAWVGVAFCVPLLLLRLWRHVLRPDAGEPAPSVAPE